MNKRLIVYCELWLSFISVGLVAAIVQILWYPLFINPNEKGIVSIATNWFGDLWLDALLVCVVLGLTLFSVIYIIYYRIWELKK